jgi:hypothetical protein
MTVAVAISYASISAERHSGGGIEAQMGAVALAQTGLNRYMAGLKDKPPARHDTTITDLIGGTARVSLRMLRESTTPVYVITSRGNHTAARGHNPLTLSAQRTVTTYAVWTPAPLKVSAGLTNLAEIEKHGGSLERVRNSWTDTWSRY